MRPLFLLLLLITSVKRGIAQQTIDEVLRMQTIQKLYNVQKTNQPITIDGKDSEEAWQAIPFTHDFMDIEGKVEKKPTYQTQIKMLWDDKNLYIYAKLDEPHIWGDLTQHDEIIYHNNDFEIFIKPHENQPTYFEIEVNTLNTILDLLMTKPYKIGGEAMLHWDVKGLQSAVYIEGTNNDAKDIDKYWAVEMAIPFTALQSFGRKATPNINEYWRINFSRVQWQHELKEGKYSRKKENGKLVPEKNWVWSPIGIIDMHLPQQWAYLRFTDTPSNKYSYPKSQSIERFTWNLYYLQKIYKRKNKNYSQHLKELQNIHSFLDKDFAHFEAEITTNKSHSFFTIEIKDKENKITTQIDSHGNYQIRYEQ